MEAASEECGRATSAAGITDAAQLSPCPPPPAPPQKTTWLAETAEAPQKSRRKVQRQAAEGVNLTHQRGREDREDNVLFLGFRSVTPNTAVSNDTRGQERFSDVEPEKPTHDVQ